MSERLSSRSVHFLCNCPTEESHFGLYIVQLQLFDRNIFRVAEREEHQDAGVGIRERDIQHGALLGKSFPHQPFEPISTYGVGEPGGYLESNLQRRLGFLAHQILAVQKAAVEPLAFERDLLEQVALAKHLRFLHRW